MLRVYHLFLAAILVLLIPVGVKFILPHFSASKVEQKKPIASTTPKTSPPVPPTSMTGNVWARVLGKNNLVPKGWEISPCEGNSPLLCVSANGGVLGTVEINVYQVKNNPNFQKHLAEAGITFGSQVDYQSSANQSKVITALKAWVKDHYVSLSQDRQKGYGNKIILSTDPLQEISIGKLPGIRYGFTAIKQEGGLQEKYISHVAFDGTVLYVISTGFDPGGATGKFEKLENLVIFQPYLDAIAENVNL